MKYNVVAFSIIGLALTGCASKDEREIASGSFKYIEAAQYTSIEIPDDLQNPVFSNRYALPDLKTESQNSLYGTRLKVSSPRLVLPLVTGSHVEEGSEDSKVLFDQINDDEPLSQTIWNTVLTYLEKQSIGVDSFDKDKNVLYTDWVIITEDEEKSWFDFNDVVSKDARKFMFSLNVAPHGRSASLTTELTEYVDNTGSSALNSLDAITKRSESTNFLNKVIAEYDFGIRLKQSQRIAEIRQGFKTDLGFDSDGEPALVVDAIYENTWPRLLLVLRKMGFDVKDLDQSTGIMFVQYNGQEGSWWDGLFSSGKRLDLEQSEYRLQVESLGAKTAVTFLNTDNKPFAVDKVTKIYIPFSEYMGTEDLDI